MRLFRLLDISGMFHPIWRVKEGANKPIGEAAAETVQALREHAARAGADFVIACCDAPGRTFRHGIAEEYKALVPDYKGYKGHRPEKDPAMMACLDRVIDELEQDGIPIMRAPGFEADDIVATITGWATAAGDSVEIVSEDKDLLAVARDVDPDNDTAPSVVVVRRDGTRQGYDQCVERLGVPPELVPAMLAMAGDTSDGILGIAGVGGKTAAALLWGEWQGKEWRPTPYRRFSAMVDAAIEDQAAVEASDREIAAARVCKNVHRGVKKSVTPDVIAEKLGITLGDVEHYRSQPEPARLPEAYRPRFAKDVRQNLITNAASFDIGLRLATLRRDVPLDFAVLTAPKVPKARVGNTLIDDATMAIIEGNEDMITDAEYTEPSSKSPEAAPVEQVTAQSGRPWSEIAQQAPPWGEVAPAAAAPADAATAVVSIEVAKEQSSKLDGAAQATALAASNPVREFERQLEPCNFVQAVRLARSIAKTRKLKDVSNEDDVLLKLFLGRSIGLNLYQAVCLFDIVEGKGAMAAQLVTARVRTHPQCEYFRKKFGDKTKAVWVSKRKGQPEAEWEFTIEDAKDAKLGGIWDKEKKCYKPDFDPLSNWTKYRKQMLSWRAALFLAREEWSEVTAGIYDPDELREQREAPASDEAA